MWLIHCETGTSLFYFGFLPCEQFFTVCCLGGFCLGCCKLDVRAILTEGMLVAPLTWVLNFLIGWLAILRSNPKLTSWPLLNIVWSRLEPGMHLCSFAKLVFPLFWPLFVKMSLLLVMVAVGLSVCKELP